jgi:uncharacterized protein (TIGR02217 family)
MVDTSFMEDVIFPVNISRGSSGGPDWMVEIVELANGNEERNTAWTAPRRSYDAAYSVRTHDEIYAVLELYHVAMGALRGFRLLDWSDYRSGPPQTLPTMLDQVLGTGDGVSTVFPLNKKYKVGASTFVRRINKPYGTIMVAKAGVLQSSGVTVDLAAGTVTFAVAPTAGQVLKWGGQFHVPVRFDGKLDQIDLQGAFENIPSIPLKELRL